MTRRMRNYLALTAVTVVMSIVTTKVFFSDAPPLPLQLQRPANVPATAVWRQYEGGMWIDLQPLSRLGYYTVTTFYPDTTTDSTRVLAHEGMKIVCRYEAPFDESTEELSANDTLPDINDLRQQLGIFDGASFYLKDGGVLVMDVSPYYEESPE